MLRQHLGEVARAVYEAPHLHDVAHHHVEDHVVAHGEPVVRQRTVPRRLVDLRYGGRLGVLEDGLLGAIEQALRRSRVLEHVADVEDGLLEVVPEERKILQPILKQMKILRLRSIL